VTRDEASDRGIEQPFIDEVDAVVVDEPVAEVVNP
jgi:hypothetical protein